MRSWHYNLLHRDYRLHLLLDLLSCVFDKLGIFGIKCGTLHQLVIRYEALMDRSLLVFIIIFDFEVMFSDNN